MLDRAAARAAGRGARRRAASYDRGVAVAGRAGSTRVPRRRRRSGPGGCCRGRPALVAGRAPSTSAPAARAAAASVVERGAGQRAVDRAEEQGGVVLVDQHGQAGVPRRAGVLLLQPQVGGVAVVAVGDQAAGLGAAASPMRASMLGVADRPDAVPLPGAVEVAPVGLGAASRSATQLAQLGGAVVHEQDRRGVELHLVIRSASSPACAGWMPSWGSTARSARSRGAPRHVEGADQAADGEPAGGVLVQVERRARCRATARPCSLPLRAAGRRRRGRVARAPVRRRDRRPGRAPA